MAQVIPFLCFLGRPELAGSQIQLGSVSVMRGRSGLYALPRLVESEKFAIYYKFYQNATIAEVAR